MLWIHGRLPSLNLGLRLASYAASRDRHNKFAGGTITATEVLRVPQRIPLRYLNSVFSDWRILSADVDAEGGPYVKTISYHHSRDSDGWRRDLRDPGRSPSAERRPRGPERRG